MADEEGYTYLATKADLKWTGILSDAEIEERWKNSADFRNLSIDTIIIVKTYLLKYLTTKWI